MKTDILTDLSNKMAAGGNFLQAKTKKELLYNLAIKEVEDPDFIPSREVLKDIGIKVTMSEDEAEKITEKALKLFGQKKLDHFKSEHKSDKEFNKNLLDIYKLTHEKIINEHGEYLLLKANNIDPILEKLLHKLAFDSQLDTPAKIKLIKNTEIDLARLIKLEHNLNMDIRLGIITRKVNIEDEETCISCLFLNTIRLIKCIKFGLSKADIASFDSGKLKKKFSKHKMITFNSRVPFINLTSKEYFDYSKLALSLSCVDNTDAIQFTVVSNAIPLDSRCYENSYELAKLLLDSKYNEMITDPFKLMETTTTIDIVDKGIFSQRKILVPNNGVVLRILNGKDLESILIKEIHCENNGCYLFTVSRYNDGKEIINIHDLQKNIVSPLLNYAKDNEDIPSLTYIYDFLGIGEYKSLKYEVISPYYWKYRGLYESSGDQKNAVGKIIKRAFDVEIAAFIRKVNGNASDEAKALAKKLFINLEDGYTIVKAHKRTYNSKYL